MARYTTISKDGIQYLCSCINQLASVSEAINNTNLADDKVFSNLYTKKLIDKCLEDANTEAQKLVGALTHLTCEETTVQPTLDNSTINVIYLYSADGNAPYQQYLKISDTKLIDLGSTSISLSDYITATEIARDYVTKLDFDALKTEVNKKVDKTDIVDNLTSSDTDKPLSANQGMLLKSMMATLTGVVLPYAGSSAPIGFLLCNGQAISRTKYQNLFDIIGTTYGEGDGSTTFNLPNLQNKFIQGTGTNVVGTEMSAGLPNITGETKYLSSNVLWASVSSGAFKGYYADNNIQITNVAKDGNGYGYYFLFNASLSNPIYGNSNTVQPPAVVMNYIIKY